MLGFNCEFIQPFDIGFTQTPFSMNSTLLFASLYLAIKDKRNTRMEISLFQEHLLSAYVHESVKIYLNHIDSQYFEFISNIFLFYLKIVI